jgi:hypothetical protein
VNYSGILSLTERQHLGRALLDTFDWSPAYDNPQPARTMANWFQRLGIQQIEIAKAGHLFARGVAEHAAGY